jgi:hypothetical protein
MIATDDIKREHGAEMAAIILCCRIFFETATINDLKAFIAENDVDWYTFIRLASKHRIRPTVYKVIHRISIPADIEVLIYKQQADITKKCWQQAIETERLILLLKQHGIVAIPYKGAAFSKQFFGDLVSRESSDIDLIIKPDDLAKAIDILKYDKYQPEIDEVYKYLGSKYHSYYKDYNLNKFEGGKRLFHVELHWAIAETYLGIDAKVNAFIYDTDKAISLAKSEVQALNKTAHFSSIIVHHGIKDTFKCLKNIVDISQGFREPQILHNKQYLCETFAAVELKKTLAISNLLSQQLMGICLFKNENVDVPTATIGYFCNQLLGDAILQNENLSNLNVWIKNRMLLQDSWVQKLHFFWVSVKHRFIPGESDFHFVQLPKPIFFIYYLMKPFRSIIKPLDPAEKKRNIAAAYPTLQ